MAGLKRRLNRRFRRRLRRRRGRRLATRSYVSRALSRSAETKCNNGKWNSTTAQPGTLYLERLCKLITQGDTMGQRTGKNIFFKFFNLSGYVVNPNTTSGNKAYLRMAILRNKTQITDYTGGLWKADSASNNNPVDFQTTGNISQINKPFARTLRSVVWQKRFIIPINAGANANNRSTMFINETVYINKRLTFTESANNVYPEYGLIWFFETETGAALFTTPMIFYWDIRCYFKDS